MNNGPIVLTAERERKNFKQRTTKVKQIHSYSI